jgi:hypothetical protein
VWVVRPQSDRVFRAMCRKWYKLRDEGTIKSDNFQLHPPRGQNIDIIRNECGNLYYPLLLLVEWVGDKYELKNYHPEVLKTGLCKKAI